MSLVGSTRMATCMSPRWLISPAGSWGRRASRRAAPAIGPCWGGCAAMVWWCVSGSKGPGRGVRAWPAIWGPRSVEVIEVDRPNRQLRRHRGKSDTVDAEAAARAALNGEATTRPKARTGPVEAMRALRVARRSAVKSRTQAMAQLRSLVSTAPEELRAGCDRCPPPGSWPSPPAIGRGIRASVIGATKMAMRELAIRVQYLEEQIDRLDATVEPLVKAVCPELFEQVRASARSWPLAVGGGGRQPAPSRRVKPRSRRCAGPPRSRRRRAA